MKKQLLGLCAIIGLGLAAQGADADGAKSYSFTLDAGVNIMDDIKAGGDKVKMDTGFGLALSGNYALNQTFSIGLETGLRYNQVKDASDGECIYQVPLLATVSLRYENESKFVPYIGLGVGGAMGIAADDTDSATDFVFAWQIEAGVRYKISDHVSAGVSYKYLGLANQDYDFGGGANVKIEDVSSHLIGASINWRF